MPGAGAPLDHPVHLRLALGTQGQHPRQAQDVAILTVPEGLLAGELRHWRRRRLPPGAEIQTGDRHGVRCSHTPRARDEQVPSSARPAINGGAGLIKYKKRGE